MRFFPLIASLALWSVGLSTANGQASGAPVIVSTAGNQTVTEGTNVSLAVSVNGTTPFSYQWRKEGAAIFGATGNPYSLVPARLADAGTYSVVITNALGSVTSGPIVLAVTAATAPRLNSSPSSTSVYVGSTLSISSSFSSSTAVSYEWRRNGVVISGATQSGYAKANVQSGDAGSYTVTATNFAGSTTSNAVTVTIVPLAAPVITSQPQDQIVNSASSWGISVSVNSGGSQESYQWSKDGVAIFGATGSSYSRADARAADTGAYTVTVTNALGAAVSTAAQVTVRPPIGPSISFSSAAQVVSAGGNFSFNVGLSGTPPISLQWYKDGALLAGETNSSLQRTTVSSAQAGVYLVVATNAQGTSSSSPARVSVLSPRAPEIFSHPVSTDVDQGDSVGLSINVSGTAPLSYQWSKDGAIIAGATSSAYSVTNRAASSDSGAFTITVTNPYGTVISESAMVSVRNAALPIITVPLSDRTVVEGTSFNLGVTVTSTTNQTTYEWKKGGVLFSTSPQVSRNGVVADAGDYTVTVTNPAGSVTSAAKVTVIPALLPEFTSHPASGSVLPGESFTGLNVALRSDTGSYALQWYRNDLPIVSATSTNYFLSSSNGQWAGTYKVVATSTAGSVTSREAVVTLDPSSSRPVIVYTSGSQSVVGGTARILQIVIVGSASVQWQRNGVNVPNATNPNFNIPSMSLADAGIYTAVATSSTAGSSTSLPIVITLADAGVAPQITTALVPQSRAVGGSVSWAVVATGERPLSYQWLKDGVPIPGVTGDAYSLSPVVATHAGKYSVSVTNRNGTVVSGEVALTTLPEALPVIRNHPVSQNVALSSSVNLSVALVSSTNVAYQWFKDGVAVTGATNSSLGVTGSPAAVGRYAVSVTNGAGSIRSREAGVTLAKRAATPPVASVSSVPAQSVFSGSTVTLSAGLTGVTTYQWRKNGVDLDSATSANLVLLNVQAADSGTYVAFGFNEDGVAPSAPAQLTVQAPLIGLPRIGTQPVGFTVLPGNNGALLAGVGANPAATYHWRRNGVVVPGATNTVLSLTNVQAAQAGSYTFVATNSFGSVTSSEAVVTLGTPITFLNPLTNQSVPAGVTFYLSAVIQSPGAVSYQWKKNGVALPGATSSTLAFSPIVLTDAGSYAVVVTNPEGSVESNTATLAITSSPFAGTYAGSFGSGDSFALAVSPEGTGAMVGVISSAGEAIIGRGFPIGPDGSFSFGGEAARPYGSYRVSGDRITGKITGNTLNGLVTGRNVAFSGGKLSAGATATLAGYYQAVPVAGVIGEVHAIAGPDGSIQLLGIDPTGNWLARGQLAAGGVFSSTLPPFTYIGTLTGSGAITGRYQMPNAALVSFSKAAAPGGMERLANVSARGLAGTGGRTLIAGFVVSGLAPKDVLVRAVGPALAAFGVPGSLANPRLRLFRDGVALFENDDWGLGGFAPQIAATAARVGGFPFATGSLDAALVARLEPGGYSAQVSGATDAVGVALVEVYDASEGTNASRLVNLSTRGEIGTGGDLLIVGVVVTGNAPKKILIRGIGPGLAAFGVPGTLLDPQLKLYLGGQLLRENDNWSSGLDATLIADAAKSVAAFTLSNGSKDAALLLYLAPGTYSAQLSGVNNTTGVGLVEAYEVP